jgi:hypothetical protein
VSGHVVEEAERRGQANGWAHTLRWRWHTDRLGQDHVWREIGNCMAHGLRPSRHVATRVGYELARGSRVARAQMSAITSHECAEPSNACGARYTTREVRTHRLGGRRTVQAHEGARLGYEAWCTSAGRPRAEAWREGQGWSDGPEREMERG